MISLIPPWATDVNITNGSSFELAVALVLKNEGGLSENPNDPGGITNWGISFRFLKTLPNDRLKAYAIFEEVTEDTIRFLTIDQAKKIYKGEFWDQAPFEKIRCQDHANYIFDMAVNMGIAPAIKCLQRACWAITKRWRELKDDGILGDKTIKTLELCWFQIMPPLRTERAAYYRAVINHNPKQKDELPGWYDRTFRD